MISPIIVIGPPRSGTTMVASVLQNWFGVLMDGAPKPSSELLHPLGFLEDSRLVEANHLYLTGVIPINAWTRRFRRFVRAMKRQTKNGLWGFKDPRLIPLLTYSLSFFDRATILRCHRRKELCVKSYVEKLDWSKEKSIKYWNNAEESLDRQLKNKPHYRIDFDEIVTEEQIIELLTSGAVLRHAA